MNYTLTRSAEELGTDWDFPRSGSADFPPPSHLQYPNYFCPDSFATDLPLPEQLDVKVHIHLCFFSPVA